MRIIKLAYFIRNAEAYFIDGDNHIYKCEDFTHFDSIKNTYGLEEKMKKAFKELYHKPIDWDRDNSWVHDYITDFMEENKIFCIIVDRNTSQVYIRPTESLRPSESQIKEVSDWAIINGYDEDIVIDQVYAKQNSKMTKTAYDDDGSDISNYPAGWILSSGEIVNLFTYEHADYVKKNPAKFNIPKNYQFFTPEEIYRAALKSGAIRFSVPKFLNLDATRSALSNLIEKIHTIYKKYGNDGGIWVSLRNVDGSFETELKLMGIDELYKYAKDYSIVKTSKFRNSYRYADSTCSSIWILPSGETIDIGNRLHTEFLFKNQKMFNIQEGEIEGQTYFDIAESELYKIGFKKGAVRIATLNNEQFNIQCTKEALSRHIGAIHRAFLKYVRANSTIFLDLENVNNETSESHILKSFGELYKYASKRYDWYKTGANKFKLTQQEKERLIEFVENIKKGYTKWSDVDSQFYQNNAKVVEQMLRGEPVDWDLLVEDELQKNLRELEEMMRRK